MGPQDHAGAANGLQRVLPADLRGELVVPEGPTERQVRVAEVPAVGHAREGAGAGPEGAGTVQAEGPLGHAVEAQPGVQVEREAAPRDAVDALGVGVAAADVQDAAEAEQDLGLVVGDLLDQRGSVRDVAVAVRVLDDPIGHAVAVDVLAEDLDHALLVPIHIGPEHGHLLDQAAVHHAIAVPVLVQRLLVALDFELEVAQPLLGGLAPVLEAAGLGARRGSAHTVQVDLYGGDALVELADGDREGLVLGAQLGHGGVAGDLGVGLAVDGLGLQRDDPHLVVLHVVHELADGGGVARNHDAHLVVGHGGREGRAAQGGDQDAQHGLVLPGSRPNWWVVSKCSPERRSRVRSGTPKAQYHTAKEGSLRTLGHWRAKAFLLSRIFKQRYPICRV